MPAKAQWLLQVPAIIEQLRAVNTPVVDRSVCEWVFGVRRRRAVELMHFFGGYQSGNTILLNRTDLIRQLEALEANPEIGRERRRKTRLAEKLDELHRFRAATSVRIAVLPVMNDVLPDGVVFESNRMTVEFAGVEELLSKLYALARVAAANFEAFCAVVDGDHLHASGGQ